MRRILAQAHIGDYHQFRGLLLDRPDCALNDPVLVPRAAAALVLGFRQAEEEHRRNARPGDFGALANDRIDREVIHARHGANLALDAGAGGDKERIDEVVDTKRGLPYHPPQYRRSTQPSRSMSFVEFGHVWQTNPGTRSARQPGVTKALATWPWFRIDDAWNRKAPCCRRSGHDPFA